MLHQVGVSFDLHYDAWKHKIKKKKIILKFVRAILGKRMWIALKWVRLGPNILAVLEKKIKQAYFQVSVSEFLDHFFILGSRD